MGLRVNKVTDKSGKRDKGTNSWTIFKLHELLTLDSFYIINYYKLLHNESRLLGHIIQVRSDIFRATCSIWQTILTTSQSSPSESPTKVQICRSEE